VNYDVPLDYVTYLHRIGRTGRAGAKGQAITFVIPEQSKRLKQIEEDLGTQIEIMPKS
jgi:superfamily II DNA/RNA helicase